MIYEASKPVGQDIFLRSGPFRLRGAVTVNLG